MFFEEPVFFEKNRVFRVYTGGKLFADFFGDDSTDGNYPEEWVASSVRALNEGSTDKYEGISKIRGTDIYLSEAVKKYKKEILGEREDIGILTKFIDSAIRLPVQAHPDKDFSRRYFNSPYGKEESWIILGTRPGAKIYYGFKKGITLRDFEKAIDASEDGGEHFENLLRAIPVKTGDIVYIPAKLVHAIGKGCLLLEIQEPTDFTIQPERYCGTYKLTDNEMYLGLPRADALKCFDMKKEYPAPLKAGVISDDGSCLYESVIDEKITDSFSVRTVTLKDGEFTLSRGCTVYVVIEGRGEIIGNNYCNAIRRGDYFLMPSCAAGKYKLSGNMKVAECFA
ncbi:MAG: class I mannose-6-phosphate isomerase [Clostridia bacterium]|nr:class I mannose-6-phosphate isomerase [Clostridia bacterium]